MKSLLQESVMHRLIAAERKAKFSICHDNQT
jgi:hypothetical protein